MAERTSYIKTLFSINWQHSGDKNESGYLDILSTDNKHVMHALY